MSARAVHDEVPGLALRPIAADDEPTLLRIYGSAREEELALTDWDTAQRAAFVAQQFAAQQRYYREYYPAASFDCIVVGGQTAGRFYVNRGADEIRIVDVTLLPAFRGRGIGTVLIRRLQTEASLARKAVTIHVERFNPALRLYERLGFRLAEDKGVYLFLRWSP